MPKATINLHKIKNILRPLFDKIRFPKINGIFYIVTRSGIFIAPSVRQAIIMKMHAKSFSMLDQYKIIANLIDTYESEKLVILDIGANIGYTAYAYSKLLAEKHGRCISFEPVSINCRYFLHNTRNIKNIFLVSLGLSNKKEVLTLGTPVYATEKGSDPSNTGLLSAKAKIDNSYETWKSGAIPLDDITDSIVEDNETVAFIKIDVEGFELATLKGSRSILQNHKAAVQIEVNPFLFKESQVKSIFSYMYDLGYNSFALEEFSADDLHLKQTFVTGVQTDVFFVHQEKSDQIAITSKKMKKFTVT